eukprot:Ihof_evm4s9 gene=Ihof_evmTU4s9
MGMTIFLVMSLLLLGNHSNAAGINHTHNTKGVVRENEPHLQDMFRSWMKKYNISFHSPVEYINRIGKFADNIRRLNAYDKRLKYGDSDAGRYSIGLNKFAHLSEDEFGILYLRDSICDTPTLSTINHDQAPNVPSEELPEFVDWRMKHVFTPTLSASEHCFSSYALATTSTIEAYYVLEGGKLANMSTQQVLDCSQPFGARGCEGGTMGQAYAHILSCGGLESAYDYPMSTGVGQCLFNKTKVVANITAVHVIPGGVNAERQMMKVVATNGPVTVAFTFNPDLQLYTGGVYSSNKCSKDLRKADYTGVVVGYKTNQTDNYWIIRANFGSDWGLDGGYFYM